MRDDLRLLDARRAEPLGRLGVVGDPLGDHEEPSSRRRRWVLVASVEDIDTPSTRALSVSRRPTRPGWMYVNAIPPASHLQPFENRGRVCDVVAVARGPASGRRLPLDRADQGDGLRRPTAPAAPRPRSEPEGGGAR